MNKLITFFTVIFLFSVTSYNLSIAQVTVSGALSGNGSYARLSDAFSAIDTVTQTGANISITISGNISEPAGAILNEGVWNSINIKPTGGAARTISGAVNGGPLIGFNGADNVTIDGLNSGGDSLTITNTSISSVAGTSTIRFETDAVNNVITRCSILGSSRTPVGDMGGTIIIGANSTTTGNDNNVISFCNIGRAGTNNPTKAIFVRGTTTTSAANNSGDTIRNCNIFNYFRSGASSGIHIDSGSADITIRDNRFFQTGSGTNNTALLHTAITIDNVSGNNFQILGNIIGYASSTGTGVYTITTGGSGGHSFFVINLNVGTNTATTVQGNTITAISYTTNFQGATPCSRMIYIQGGLVNVTGNTIGSMSSTGSVTINLTSINQAHAEGISNYGASNWTCSNNSMGGITVTRGGLTGSFHCIRGNTSSSTTFTCQNNTIGGLIANSIQLTASGFSASINGILNNGPSGNITGNLIRNLTATGGTGTNNSASVSGIVSNTAGSANHNVSQNTIHSLTNTNSSAATVVTGIYFNSLNGTNLISRNFIHTFKINSQSATMNGIVAENGTGTFQNNMIRLGLDVSGNSIDFGASINGLSESTGGSSYYFNSIYIGGSPTGGSFNTYALSSTVTASTRVFRNNIFYNARSNNGSSGKHYGVRVGGTSADPPGLTMNNNVIFTTGIDGVFGFFNGADINDLSSWQTTVGQDSNSFFNDPNFIEPNGSVTSLDLHIDSEFPTIIDSKGFDIPSVTVDYDGQLRTGLTPVDIGADAGDFPPLFSNDVKTSGFLRNQVILVGKSYDVIATVINIGVSSQDSIPVYYSVNGGLPRGPVLAVGSIEQFETKEVTFSGIHVFTPSVIGIHTLKIFSALGSDQYRVNDTTTLFLNAQQQVSTFPSVEMFNNLINWSVFYENPLYDISLWELGLSTSPSGQNSDIAATSNCYYGAPGRREILKSFVFDLSSFTSNAGSSIPALSFYTAYTGYPDLDDTLEVLLSTDNGLTFFSASTVYNKSRNTTPSLATRPAIITEYFPDSLKQWRHEQLSLANVAGQSSVIIGFRSKSDFGNRQWLDNVIVSKASSFTEQTVNSPGTFNFGNVSIEMNTVGLRHSIPGEIHADRHSGISKMPPEKNKIVGNFPIHKGTVKLISSNEADNSGGGDLTVVTYSYQDPVPTYSTPEFSTNHPDTGVTTGDGSRFTPNKALPDVFLSASYSGNDYLGYANYDIRINVTGINSITDINKAYIMKRADLTDSWVCLNTTVAGDTLIASSLDNFSDFSIGIRSGILNLTMFIEGFYRDTSNTQVSDTIKVLLRNTTSPYSPVDSATSFVSAGGIASITFPNTVTGTYYFVLKHRNSIETWSASGVGISQGGSVSYNFSNAAAQAFGDNMKQVDTSPVRFAIYSGDVDQNGFIDGSDGSLIDNDAYNFASGYLVTDIDGNEFIDGTDAAFVDNNAFNFVGKVTP